MSTPSIREIIRSKNDPSFLREDDKRDDIDRLSSIGLNKIHSWTRPFRSISNDEQSRVSTTLSLGSGVVLDNFACFVDDQNAISMAVSIGKFIIKHGVTHVR